MGKGVTEIIVGFFVSVLSAMIPILGIPILFIGVAIMIWGIFQLWFGAGKSIATGVSRAAGNKTGTGKL